VRWTDENWKKLPQKVPEKFSDNTNATEMELLEKKRREF